jgi:hypothetical protein
MTTLSEERLAELIALLRPAPEPWTRAAIELPKARLAIDELVARATADHQIRQAILADLDGALRGVGVEPRPRLLDTLRARLGGLDQWQ